jgi:hypothetical protein
VLQGCAEYGLQVPGMCNYLAPPEASQVPTWSHSELGSTVALMRRKYKGQISAFRTCCLIRSRVLASMSVPNGCWKDTRSLRPPSLSDSSSRYHKVVPHRLIDPMVREEGTVATCEQVSCTLSTGERVT